MKFHKIPLISSFYCSQVKELVNARDWNTLLQSDQLKTQQSNANVFVNYVEGDITFPPTYKYDLFSDDYDTSEKCRAPAWTDRVLFRKRREGGQNPGKVVYYGRAELKQSDHRPVIAFIDIDILETRVDRARTVLEDVIGRLGPPDSTVIVAPSDGQADSTSWADDDALLTAMLGRINQTAGEVLLIRFTDEGLWLTLRDGLAALAAVKESPMQIGPIRLALKLKSNDYPAAVARDLLLAAGSAVPLCDTLTQDRIVDEDVRVLANLANTLSINEGK